jgi:hypothetical protein
MILTDACPHLRNRRQCNSSKDYFERSALQLQLSYLASVLSRPSLEDNAHLNKSDVAYLREQCLSSLVNVIKAFLELQSIRHNSARSWLYAQHAIMSAHILAVTNDSKSDPQVRDLVEKLEQVLALEVYQDRGSEEDQERPLASLLSGLQKLSSFFDSPVTEAFPKAGETSPVSSSAGSAFMWPKMSASSMTFSPSGGLSTPGSFSGRSQSEK